MEGNSRRFGDCQKRFRNVNETIRLLGGNGGSSKLELDFICECADERCFGVLRVPLAEYESVRSAREQFLVLPGHEWAGPQRVVRRTAAYLVVESPPGGAAGPAGAGRTDQVLLERAGTARRARESCLVNGQRG